jgi:PAS domain S-box-containing protein
MNTSGAGMFRKKTGSRPDAAQESSKRVREFAEHVRRFSAARESRRADTLAEPEPRHELVAHLEAAEIELRVAAEQLEEQNGELERLNFALADQVRRYRDLFDNAPDAYLVTSPHGIIREANAAAGTLLGVPARFLGERSLLHFVARRDTRDFRAALKQLGAQPDSVALRVRMRPRGGGGVIVVDLKAAPVRDRKGTVLLRWMAHAVAPEGDAAALASTVLGAVEVLRSPASLADDREAALLALVSVARSLAKNDTDSNAKSEPPPSILDEDPISSEPSPPSSGG